MDGGDWSRVWALKVFCDGLLKLGYRHLPPCFFAPVIVDWSGAKFSKSMYLKGGVYDYLPKGLIDFSSFIDEFGEDGFMRLWEEAQSWIEDPRKLFRNYSVEYFRLTLED